MVGRINPEIHLTNDQVAAHLEEIAELLEAQDANVFRVGAYRRAAETVRGLATPLHALLAAEDLSGLRRLPGIGWSLARAIEDLLHTGRLALLDRLRGASAPEAVLMTVPGLGPRLAARVHEQLGIESLAELEIAAYDGRLARVQGFGPGRTRAVRESIAGRFRRRPYVPESALRAPRGDEPSVAELLDVDAEYRRKAAADRLPRIAPRRFNPERRVWLPILHASRGARHYTALYSNTARAHELGACRDWVVIYRDDRRGAGQWTVITARIGDLAGRRIVRGREAECRRFHDACRPRERRAAVRGGGVTRPAPSRADGRGPRRPSRRARSSG